MPVRESKGNHEHRLGRMIGACRTLLAGLRRWGPLALREITDDCQSALGADRALAGEDPAAKGKRRPA